jgi:hypothetical protein
MVMWDGTAFIEIETGKRFCIVTVLLEHI